MLEHVRQTIQKFQLITTGQTLVVGVSGGADSLALLHILNQLAPRMGFKLHAATLDHLLRGEESASDARFVEQTCHEWGIAVTVGQADVTRLEQEQQLGIEAAARLARYDFLAQITGKLAASTIAVAHHADDQAETVLMHLLRGAGIQGLAGMALRSSVPGHADLSLIRPLLQVSRAEIEDYCEQHHLVPRYDSTNSDTTLLRNAIRLNLLPYLEQYTPQVRPALARLAEIAAVEDDYLQQHVLLFVQSAAVTVSPRRVSIDRDAFRGLHAALQRRVLLWTIAQIGSLEHVTAQLIVNATELAIRGKQGAIALLGGGFRLRVEYNSLVLEAENDREVEHRIPLLSPNFSLHINIPSVNSLAGWTLNVTTVQPVEPQSFGRLCIANDSQLVLRTRQEGDIFSPLGMNGHTQKLSRWMVNRKIPKIIRDQIPLFIVNGTVAAIVVNNEWFVSETFAVRNKEVPIIYFQFLENS